MSPWIIIGMVLVFGYFTYREIRDYFFRSYRLLNKAIKFYENGLYAQALPYAEKALEKYEKRIDVDPQEMINFLEVLANVHWQLENHEKAKQMFQRSLEISEDVWGRDSLKAAENLTELGKLQLLLRDPEGMSSIERALEITEKKLGKDHERTKEIVELLENIKF